MKMYIVVTKMIMVINIIPVLWEMLKTPEIISSSFMLKTNNYNKQHFALSVRINIKKLGNTLFTNIPILTIK